MKFNEIMQVNEAFGHGLDSMGIMKSLRSLPWVKDATYTRMNNGFAALIESQSGEFYEFQIREADFAEHPDLQAVYKQKTGNSREVE